MAWGIWSKEEAAASRRVRAAQLRREAMAQRTPSAESLLTMAQLLLAMAMTQMRTEIEPKIGLLLAFETLNAMAKSAPLLPRRIQELFRACGQQSATAN